MASIRIHPYSRGALMSYYGGVPYALTVLIREGQYRGYQRAFYIRAGTPVPGQFLAAFLRREFTRHGDTVAVVADFAAWNGSYHDPDYAILGDGEAVLLVRGRRVRHIFSRIRRAVRQAVDSWRQAQAESVRARLVERRVWRREGD